MGDVEYGIVQAVIEHSRLAHSDVSTGARYIEYLKVYIQFYFQRYGT